MKKKTKTCCNTIGMDSVSPSAFFVTKASGAMPVSPLGQSAGDTNSPLDSHASIGDPTSPPVNQLGIDYYSAAWDCASIESDVNFLSQLLEKYYDNKTVITVETGYSYSYLCRASLGATLQFRHSPEGIRVYLTLPGQSLAVLSEYTLRTLMEWVSAKPNSSHTRIDFFVDDRTKSLDLGLIEYCLVNGDYKGYSTGEVVRSYGGKKSGTTVYFGGRKSESRTRFYDKAAEQGLESDVHWVRQETQFRGRKCNSVVKMLLEERTVNLCTFAKSVLIGVMSMGVRKGKNLDRFVVADFWKEWTKKVSQSPLKVPTISIVRTIERSLCWFGRAATKALAKMKNALGNDFEQAIQTLIAYGEARLRSDEIEDISLYSSAYNEGDFFSFYRDRVVYSS